VKLIFRWTAAAGSGVSITRDPVFRSLAITLLARCKPKMQIPAGVPHNFPFAQKFPEDCQRYRRVVVAGASRG
jgi:hypothetical protein